MIKYIIYLIAYLFVFSFKVSAISLSDGLKLFNAEKFHEAKSVFEPLAKKGDARALFWLNNCS